MARQIAQRRRRALDEARLASQVGYSTDEGTEGTPRDAGSEPSAAVAPATTSQPAEEVDESSSLTRSTVATSP
jgi:hypothetical protein